MARFVTGIELPVVAQPSTPALSRAASTRVVYGISVTLSAALAFLAEPMVARVLLPVYGGSAAVWATSLVFFQVALLLGYCAAHVLRRRPLVQLGLLIVPLALVPIWFSAPSAPPAGIAPSAWLIGQLALMVGAPFVALGSAGPALQRWFATAPRAATGVRDAGLGGAARRGHARRLDGRLQRHRRRAALTRAARTRKYDRDGSNGRPQYDQRPVAGQGQVQGT